MCCRVSRRRIRPASRSTWACTIAGWFPCRTRSGTSWRNPREKRELGGLETQAYVAYILALAGRANNADQDKWLDDLYVTRGEQGNYGRALLALTYNLRKQDDRASLLLQNILQFAARDDSNETAWIRTPQEGWWFWWNNDIETNAWVLKALTRD